MPGFEALRRALISIINAAKKFVNTYEVNLLGDLFSNLELAN